MQISQITFMNMWISAIISVALPFVLLIVWKKKNRKIKIAPFFAGALTFIVFALILETMCHQFFLVKESPLSVFINGNTWAFVLYGALAAGLFEETGRFLTMKIFLKKENTKEAAVTYGIGHGGVEAALLVGVSMLSSIILLRTINSMGGLDAYLLMMPEESRALVSEGMMTYYTTPPYVYLLTGIERVIMIIFHIALSVFVFMAARRPGKWYYYPLAIAVHAFMNVFTVLHQRGVIGSILLIEAIIAVITAVTVWFAYRMYQKDTEV